MAVTDYPVRRVTHKQRPRCLGAVVMLTLECGHKIPAEYDRIHGFIMAVRRHCYLCPKAT